jgi:hypothetical protein
VCPNDAAWARLSNPIFDLVWNVGTSVFFAMLIGFHLSIIGIIEIRIDAAPSASVVSFPAFSIDLVCLRMWLKF